VFVTLDGYAVEGGFDGPRQPATCFTPTVALGRHDGPGEGAGLWRDYEEVLELVPGLGVDGVRLSLEWARIEPRRGVIDDAAVDRYVRAVSFARGLGLEVVVVLVDQAWPSWLGLEAWLLPWVEPCVVEHARTMATIFGDVIDEMVIFADRRALVTGGYLDATVPPWRRGAHADAVAADRQLHSIVNALRDDALVGTMMVDTLNSVTIGLSVGEIARTRANDQIDRVFVRSLVAGAGPTGSPTGLAVRHATHWAIEADEELLAVLR